MKSKLKKKSKSDMEKAAFILEKFHTILYEDNKNRIDLFHSGILKPNMLTYYKDLNRIYHIGENQPDFSIWLDLMYKRLNMGMKPLKWDK